ncbi:hypothetical protein EG329_005604 [Mollisiaceae sp. DMI_Dod_QoI]|nr:hypothetical protein EG329_005604 [Helotiales sp. DMI_Dod_QoI]
MCTLFFVQYSDWDNFAQMFMYDHNCVQIGQNPKVSRTDLSNINGWAFNSELPNSTYVRIDDDFDPTKHSDTQYDPPSIYTVWTEYKGWPSAPLLENYWGLANQDITPVPLSGQYAWWMDINTSLQVT